MTRINEIQPRFVEFIPEHVEWGVLYISRRFATATHLCCCGCGQEVVTPLNPAKWRLIVRGEAVSLSPSIGNWSIPCKSHYWISGNHVRWADTMSPELIAAVKAQDRFDAIELGKLRSGRIRAIPQRAVELWNKVKRLVRRWLHR